MPFKAVIRALVGGVAFAAALAFAQAPVEVSFYYPVAVGGPITKIIDGLAADFEKENPGIALRVQLRQWSTRTDQTVQVTLMHAAVGVMTHGAEFPHGEFPAVMPNPHLFQDGGTWRHRLNDDCDQQQQR